ncbi:MAG: MaoC/PaaZ C-terminal domain-containing protein, partial [Planctomycetota bacterium]
MGRSLSATTPGPKKTCATGSISSLITKRFTSFASRTISAQDIADYCDLSGDHNPLHKDDEWVRANTPFEQRIAHGLL